MRMNIFIAFFCAAAFVVPSSSSAMDAGVSVSTKTGNDHPIVLVHGFIGWGRDELLGFKYWGGFHDWQEELEDRGHQVHTVAVGPVSSNWDRACEMYAQLVGGRVDYGAHHAWVHGHDRFGRDYGRGLFEDWGDLDQAGHPRKIHILAHSQGGQTARILIHLLKYGAGEEIDEETANNSLFHGGRDNWVDSLTTLSAPHDGTSLATGVNTFLPFAKNLIAVIAAMSGLANDALLYDFKLDQWGLRREDGEPFKDYCDRVWASSVWDPDVKDISAWDLSPDGAKEINERYETVDEVYYFSYATEATFRGFFTGHHYPELTMFLPFHAFGLFMGAYRRGGNAYEVEITSAWFRNDGIVNTISMDGPTLGHDAVIRGWDGTPRRGQWTYLGLLESWDHFDVIGTGERPARGFVRDLAGFLNALPQ
ncbi:Secreted lipase [Sulfidibacter corallicola]